MARKQARSAPAAQPEPSDVQMTAIPLVRGERIDPALPADQRAILLRTVAWSGRAGVCDVPPPMGSRVRIALNGWENVLGTVCGYRVDGVDASSETSAAGWLMVCVRPDARPEWHRREMPNRNICVFAGCELELFMCSYWQRQHGREVSSAVDRTVGYASGRSAADYELEAQLEDAEDRADPSCGACKACRESAAGIANDPAQCPGCGAIVHASESDDLDRCASCAAKAGEPSEATPSRVSTGMKASYEHFVDGELPAGLRFDVTPETAGKDVEVCYGGEDGYAGSHVRGAPWMRVRNRATGTAPTFFRLAGAVDADRAAARAFEGSKANDMEKLNAKRAGKLQPVRFDTSVFRDAHGKEPRGRGGWMFVFGKLDYDKVEETWSPPGGAMLFAEAKRLAEAEARRRGVSLVGVCS